MAITVLSGRSEGTGSSSHGIPLRSRALALNVEDMMLWSYAVKPASLVLGGCEITPEFGTPNHRDEQTRIRWRD
jgi:hypothetical protein